MLQSQSFQTNTRNEISKQNKATRFSIDPIAPLSTVAVAEPEEVVTDTWRDAQAEEPERWDGLS
jgi:hypothetical protein